MFDIMLPAFITSVILVGIHSYLGLHIIARGVIFVDLALAQMAALGAVVGVFFGFDLGSINSYFFSLLFTFIGAIFFALTRDKDTKPVIQEAIIGITYVVSSSLSILLLDKLPAETQHLKEMFVGNILFVSWNKILKTTILYSFVGFVYYIFRDKFNKISFNYNLEKDISAKFWDFLFYALFGVVVTSSVEIAGVLLVFSFLIIPAFTSIYFFNTVGKRLIFAWFFGVIGSILGSFYSARYDFPTGPSIVVFFSILSIISLIISKIKLLIKGLKD